MRLLVLLTLFFAKEVLSCQWVCVDKKNNIKKHYFDKNKLKMEYSVPIVDVSASLKGDKKRNSALPGKFNAIFSALDIVHRNK